VAVVIVWSGGKQALQEFFADNKDQGEFGL
jgi:hypothetical protein